jgi:fused signal recognition particle receptor
VIIAIVIAAIVVVAAIIGFGILKARSAARLGSAPSPASLHEPKAPGISDASQPDDALRHQGDTEPAALGSDDDEASPSYRERLGRSRGIFDAIRSKVGRTTIDQGDLDDLEEALIRADIGVSTTQRILTHVAAAKKAGAEEDLLGLVRHELLRLLTTSADGTAINRDLDDASSQGRVAVWLFVGVNGVGKTTTIGKIATARASAGDKIVLAAGDTFRAAAGEQLESWGERSGAEVIRGAEGADPSAVIFDAIQRAKARDARLVLADTAGRLHNKVNLVEELKKIRRVADREPGEVRETLLVLDATTGQNGLVQAREFLEATGVTGVVLTKLDGSAKGGVVVAIEAELGIPVKLVGLGERAPDLVAFDPDAFVDALLSR